MNVLITNCSVLALTCTAVTRAVCLCDNPTNPTEFQTFVVYMCGTEFTKSPNIQRFPCKNITKKSSRKIKPLLINRQKFPSKFTKKVAKDPHLMRTSRTPRPRITASYHEIPLATRQTCRLLLGANKGSIL